MICTGKKNDKKENIHKSKHNYKIQNSQCFALDKLNVARVHNCVSLSSGRCFLSFHLKIRVVEVLLSSGIEDHTFGPTNVREQFPEEESTLGRSRLLEVDSLMEWE